jgi:hypothetical protein
MQFELRNHPAIADHPFKKGEKLMDTNGNPVPLFPDQRALYMDGWLIAYVVPCDDGCKTLFIKPESILTKPVIEAGRQFVADNFASVVGGHVIAEPVEEDEGFEDDDE